MRRKIIALLAALAMLTLNMASTQANGAAVATLSFSPASSSVGVGGTVDVAIDLAAVTNLFGYQFIVNYDSAKVSASGVFVNTFFDTASGAYIVWNADCTAPGTCKFAVSKQNSGGGEVNGSGTLAKITFTGVAPGTVPLTFSSNKLSDRDGSSITHSVETGVIYVHGYATFSGVVKLQGRLTPIDTGTVTLTDASGEFAQVVATFNATTGAWSASVPVTLTGSTYNLKAAHLLYLGNQKLGVAVTAGSSFPQATTTLRGGDATNNGVIDIGDLACIGYDFGTTNNTCSGGDSDINQDGETDIYDLTLAGGNFELFTPLSW